MPIAAGAAAYCSLLIALISGASPRSPQHSNSTVAAAARGQGPTQRESSALGSRIYKLEELTWPQIDAFDRQPTLFILPVGMIEQHGLICLLVPTPSLSRTNRTELRRV